MGGWMKKKNWCGCRPSCLVPGVEKPKGMEKDHPKTGSKPNNVRLCSPMFAYVRFFGKKMLRRSPRSPTASGQHLKGLGHGRWAKDQNDQKDGRLARASNFKALRTVQF